MIDGSDAAPARPDELAVWPGWTEAAEETMSSIQRLEHNQSQRYHALKQYVLKFTFAGLISSLNSLASFACSVKEGKPESIERLSRLA